MKANCIECCSSPWLNSSIYYLYLRPVSVQLNCYLHGWSSGVAHLLYHCCTFCDSVVCSRIFNNMSDCEVLCKELCIFGMLLKCMLITKQWCWGLCAYTGCGIFCMSRNCQLNLVYAVDKITGPCFFDDASRWSLTVLQLVRWRTETHFTLHELACYACLWATFLATVCLN